jgi:hypothetical protein
MHTCAIYFTNRSASTSTTSSWWTDTSAAITYCRYCGIVTVALHILHNNFIAM